MTQVLTAHGTNVVVGIIGGAEAEPMRQAIGELSQANREASQTNVVTQKLADAYLNVFGVPYPAAFIGMPYSHLMGSAFDPNLVLRT